MSIKLMSQVWELTLPHNEKLVLLALADHANDDGFCFPSIRRVAWKTDYSARAIQRIFRELESRKLIEIIQESYRPGQPRHYMIYLANGEPKEPFETGDNMTPVPDESGATGDTATSQTGDTSGATGDTATSQTGDTTTSSESSVEPSLESSENHQSRARFAKNRFRDTEGNLWELRDFSWLLIEAAS